MFPTLRSLLCDLRLPLLQAPMFLVSSAGLAAACCRAGIIGSFQLANPRTVAELDEWLESLDLLRQQRRSSGESTAPYCVNINANAIDIPEYAEKIERCAIARVPLVLSSIGDPVRLVERVHGWGGRVVHDVTTMRFAEKAVRAGVDGLMLNCSGAGGHTGALSPFAFVPQVRRMFDGAIVVAGGIAEANGIRGALALGADLVCMGTRFVATTESAAPLEYKKMLVDAVSSDVMESAAIAGLAANWLVPSMIANGLDPAKLPAPCGMHRPNLPAGVKAWRNVWSAGHSTGLIDDIPSVAALVERLADDLRDDLPLGWRDKVANRLRC
jgi:nitronate monooxygenase